ncbi:hypothetical protein F5Y09DRAFT_357628 [Xylaria sp. FL1042]|nr:hypothetical protein F5Y09DRAFT_357628 [Xylaria sp. FL1042]
MPQPTQLQAKLSTEPQPHIKPIRFLLLGAFQDWGRAEFVCAVDVEPQRSSVTQYRDEHFPDVGLLFVPPFTIEMPQSVRNALDDLAACLGIDCAIIATEPQSHHAYGMWAIQAGLNVIMDKPHSTRRDASNYLAEAFCIAKDFDEFDRRNHPVHVETFKRIRDIAERTGCLVTNVATTHCDGQWRFPVEMVNQSYHGGYHYLDMLYKYIKAGWTEGKQPDKAEIISSFIMPNGINKTAIHEDYVRLFGPEYEEKFGKYTSEEIKAKLEEAGEYDSNIQVTFFRDEEPVSIAMLNMLHNGFSRRTRVDMGNDSEQWYHGTGRCKHETHEIRSGPFQTVIQEARRAIDNKAECPVLGKPVIGAYDNFDCHVFRNCGLLGEEEPLVSYNLAECAARHDPEWDPIYTDNVDKDMLRVMDDAYDFFDGRKSPSDLISNIDDHSIPAHMMSACYVSHIRRLRGENPIVTLDLTYTSALSPDSGHGFAFIREDGGNGKRQSDSTETKTQAGGACACM